MVLRVNFFNFEHFYLNTCLVTLGSNVFYRNMFTYCCEFFIVGISKIHFTSDFFLLLLADIFLKHAFVILSLDMHESNEYTRRDRIEEKDRVDLGGPKFENPDSCISQFPHPEAQHSTLGLQREEVQFAPSPSPC